MKYKNLQAAAKAFASGKLDRKKHALLLDNDFSCLTYIGEPPEEMKKDSDEFCAFVCKENDKVRRWFKGNGYNDMVDALSAAGIPVECA